MKQLIMVLGLVSYACLAGATAKDLEAYSSKDFLKKILPTGCQPKGAKMAPDGKYLYLAEMCGKVDPKTKKRVPTASIYDVEKMTLHKTLITPAGIRKNGILANTEVDFTLDGKWALIARAEGDADSEVFKNQGLVTVVNTKTQKIAKYIPTYGQGAKIIATRPAVTRMRNPQQIVYVANYFSDDISVLDFTTMQDNGKLDGTAHFVKKIDLQTHFKPPVNHGYKIAPRGVAFTPDGSRALVLNTESGSIFVVDSINHRQLAELAPIGKDLAGRELNVRHIVTSKDGELAYLSHMRGNAVSRISVRKLMETVEAMPDKGPEAVLPESTWNDLLVPFNTASGLQKILILEDYPKDHPNFPNKKWPLAHPNTIVLDPINNRYLYVSARTTTTVGDTSVDSRIAGKIDVVDTVNGNVVFTFVGGSQPTALEISPDGKTLISSALVGAKLFFFDVGKVLKIYEQ
ncbi:beta-propeller fold lactonase family protein [Bdellovibrio sp. HCB274]|uniref:beta-propeller fold lactonase family protein n=1 Tax=Bdellovibrio sp. HCB274 TaxID=3394361 RepID=UPI0039B473EE